MSDGRFIHTLQNAKVDESPMKQYRSVTPDRSTKNTRDAQSSKQSMPQKVP
jgi:hypothetical protein